MHGQTIDDVNKNDPGRMKLTYQASTLEKFMVKHENENLEYNKIAIRSLVKRLRRSFGVNHIKNLIFALENKTPKSECVTIPRSQDGRIQIANRKATPHVLFSSIFRWSHVKSHHEIIGCCKHSVEKQLSKACINPYHYMLRHEHNKIKLEAPECLIEDSIEEIIGSDSVSGDEDDIENSKRNIKREAVESSDEFSTSSDDDVPLDRIGFVPKIRRRVKKRPFRPIRKIIRPIKTSVFTQPIHCSVIAHTSDVKDAELQPWGSIKYHEFENPLGSTLLANCSKVNIVNSINDVQQNSFEQIFQLQDIFNINRSKDSIDAQKNIGQGILLMWQHERLILQNNTSASLFLESALISLNLSIRVIEVHPGTTNLIFNTQDFDDELKKSLNYGYQRVYDTRQYCSLRIYLKSPLDHFGQVVLSSCWLEVNLFSPLKLLDKVLLKMKPKVEEL